MLAQNFMSHVDLGILEAEQQALVKVLGMLERGELKHLTKDAVYEQERDHFPEGAFSMHWWDLPDSHHCGTVHCIGGWAEKIGNLRFAPERRPDGLERLFYPARDDCDAGYEATTSQAASALRNYLRTGEPNWTEALS